MLHPIKFISELNYMSNCLASEMLTVFIAKFRAIAVEKLENNVRKI